RQDRGAASSAPTDSVPIGSQLIDMKFQAIKGTRDILPPDSALWNRVEQTARNVFGTYGYSEIRTPIFEHTELFARSIGADTDVVAKEMYTFDDRDGDTVTLRPEATASVCRAYIEHGMHTLPGNVKLYNIGPMFRRERPQKGRYRQFFQIDAEVLGQSDAPAIDAEVIEMLLVFFERVGLRGATLSVNSIGDKNCRPQYVGLLREELRKVKDKLGADSQRRIETNPLRVLDSKLPEEQAIIETLPRVADHLCDDCRAHFAKLQAELKLRGISYEINWRLVRGLDYYMRTTFEIVAPGLGSQNAVCGGGRYDGLVELLGGPPTKGIGFAIGTDRLILSLQEAAKETAPGAASTGGLDVFIAWMGEKSYAPSVQLARKLRDAGFAVELPPEEMKFKKSIGLADKLGAKYALIIGEDEVASGQYSLKRLADGQQTKYSLADLLEHLHGSRRTT
ncbi:MAG: histidine--tRNA ligase, partial [Candidatus Acidiferrales bacterium]